MRVRIVKWGNSLAVRLPKPAIEEARLKEGDSLEIEATIEGTIELHKVRPVPTLRQLVAEITPENRYGEVSTGGEVGKEIIEW